MDLCIQGFDICTPVLWTCPRRMLFLVLHLLSGAVLIHLLA
jgi:hypothetical protein